MTTREPSPVSEPRPRAGVPPHADPERWIEGIHEIPDPAVHLASAPIPPPLPPAEPSPTRLDRRRRAWAATAFTVAWLLVTVGLIGLRPDLASLVAMAPIAGWSLGGAVVLGVVLRPQARGLPAGVRAVQHAVWVVPAAYALGAGLIAAPSHVPLAWATVRTCIGVSTVIALGPLAAAALFLRGSFLSAPGWRGAAIGGLAGLAGSIGVHAHCPLHDIGHLLTAHGAAIGLAAVAGALLGRLGGRA